jgi:hypothetical protein
MKMLLETLEALKPLFLHKLDYELFVYTHFSVKNENPMWIQMDSIWGNVELKFSNSQDKNDAFYIPVTEEQQQIINGYRDECYDYFKYAKYMYIKDNYPTVWNEVASGFNGSRINSFIDNWKM